VDTNKVGLGEAIAGISALALFVFMFLPWYGLGSVGGFDVSGLGGNANAWEVFSFVDILLFLIAAIVVGLVVAQAAERTPELPQPPALIIAALGVAALVLILFRLIVTPGVGEDVVDVDLSRKIGIFLGLIAAAGIAYGGWRAMSEPAGAGATGGPAGGSTAASSAPPPPPPSATADEQAPSPPADRPPPPPVDRPPASDEPPRA
jgi:hypothetical protein